MQEKSVNRNERGTGAGTVTPGADGEKQMTKSFWQKLTNRENYGMLSLVKMSESAALKRAEEGIR